MKGLHVIGESVSKFDIVLFMSLCASSLLLLVQLPGTYKLLIIDSVIAGIVYFMILTMMALVPLLWGTFTFILRSPLAKFAVLVVSWLVAYLVLFPSLLFFFVVAIGGLAWLINISVISCILPYSVSTKLADHSPRALGWIIFLLVAIVNAAVYIAISRITALEPFLYLYVIAWLTPCVLISLVKYRDRRLFVAYMLMALVYSLYPVGYRLYSLLSTLLSQSGGVDVILSSYYIEEAVTVFMFAWALNSVGKLASNEYKLFKDGKERLKDKFTSPLRRLRRRKIDPEHEAYASAATLFDEFRKEELAVNPILVFGLLFSALSYFAYRHGYMAFGIPNYLEPGIGLVLSMIVTVPLLFYIVIKRKRIANRSNQQPA